MASQNTSSSFFAVWDLPSAEHGVLKLAENSWFALSFADIFGVSSIDLDDPDSELNISFSFRQENGIPEIGGFMLLHSLSEVVGGSSGNQAFNLVGTQDRGLTPLQYDQNGSAWQNFTINLDSYLSGSYSYIVFVNDCDADCGNSDVRFKNVSFNVPAPGSVMLLSLGLSATVFLSKRSNKA